MRVCGKINIFGIYIKTSTNSLYMNEDAFKLAKKIGATLFSTPFSVRAVKFLRNIK